VFRLFGGAVDWKAARQHCVTTSTTEAELLSLSHAASEYIWWCRLFAQMEFNPGEKPIIYCDNENTTGLVNKESMKLHTRLRHVNIQQHWLRERTQPGHIDVKWIPTKDMPADRLTKSLGRQRHADFMRLLGLRDLKAILGPREWED
jgi:hypothetical protein